jgi:cytochrome c553
VTVIAAAVLALTLSPAAQRGKQLYLTGESAGKRPVTALLGDDDVEVPATVVPCASCHARDGRGRKEGGLVPPNLQWDVLTHALTSVQRTRAAYTRSQVKRAVTLGLGVDGKPLQKTMPRYRMTIGDIEDLLAYLERLANDREPGVSDDALRIGVILPPDAEDAAAVRATLVKYFEPMNVFGRRLVPVFTTANTPATDQQVFAIGAAWLTEGAARQSDVPTIASLSVGASGDDRFMFRLLAGDREQGLALLAAAKIAPGARIALIGDQPGIRDALAAAGYARVEQATSVADGAAAVLFLGEPSALPAILEQAASRSAPVLIPAAHTSDAVGSAPSSLDRRIYIAVPSSPDDVTREGVAELQALGVSPEHAMSCSLALASAKLLVEALRRAGRDVDRDSLVTTLQMFYRMPTALTPPITWTRADHTGTRSARVLSIDLELHRWVDLGWWPSQETANARPPS